MHYPTVLLTAGLLIALPAQAEPVEVLGGPGNEIVVSDGINGVDLDIDGDGIDDLNFAYFGITVNSIFAWDAIVQSADGVSDAQFAAFEDGNKTSVHPRLAEGNLIDGSLINGSTWGKVGYEVFMDGSSGGDWLDFERGYVGFSFRTFGGKGFNFGWAEVSIDQTGGTDDGFLIVHAVGYEDSNDTPIQAGAGGQSGCGPADLTGDGSLDFFDVSDFLNLFSSMDPIADWNNDGSWDFFDVSDFLSDFSAGCP